MSENSKNKKETEIKAKLGTEAWLVFFWEFFLFFLTLGLGIATAFRITKILEVQKTVFPQISPGKFILYFLIATLFILLISYFLKLEKKRGAVFKTLFILAVFWGGLFFLEVWLPKPFPLILVAVLIFWWWKNPLVLNQDILMILGMAGVGSALGLSFQPLAVVGLLVIFSIYDFIAVYKTKHMVKMARVMIESGAILGLILPSKISDFKTNLKEVSLGGKFLILGGGDIVFPLILCVSLVPYGVFQSLIVAFFAIIGLAFSFYFFISQPPTSSGGGRQPIPALPPIALFSIIGFLITLLF